MSVPIIAFVGAGNMARSLIGGLLASGHDPARIRASDPDQGQQAAARALGIAASGDNAGTAADADVVVLAVKPQVLGGVVSNLPLTDRQLVISIAAGVPLESLARWTSPNQPLVRCMPNTPALLRAGITGLHANAIVNTDGRALAERVLGAAGRTVWVETEAELDAVTAVSGSGPAYFFYLMEAMIDAGESLGLSRTTAAALALETAYGAALMAREPGADPATLRRNVTSPGGTTERALEILDAAGTHMTIENAIRGAAVRARELAGEFGRS